MRRIAIMSVSAVLGLAAAPAVAGTATVQTNGIECVPVWGPSTTLTYSEVGIFNASNGSQDVICPLMRASADSDTGLSYTPNFWHIFVYTRNTSQFSCTAMWYDWW